MPSFRYKARDQNGAPQAGVTTAANSGALIAELRGRGLLVLEVREAAEAAPKRRSHGIFSSILPATKFDVEIGLQQMSSMLRSGLTLLAAIKTAGEQARRKAMTRVWEDVYERIEEGASFSEALAYHERLFPSYLIELVRVGEQSGSLEVVMSRGADHLSRRRYMRFVIINALIYPAIVMVMSIGVTAYMLLGVIPKIQKFLNVRGRALPAMTQALMDVSNWMQAYFPYLAIGTMVGLLVVAIVYQWPPGRLGMDRFVLRVPIAGNVARLAGTAIFARGLGTLLESGVTLLDGLRTVEPLVGNRYLSNCIGEARMAVLRGGTLAESLDDRRAFMPMLPRMVAVGETTGTLDPVLEEVARFHEEQLNATVRRLSVMVEPAIIIVVGSIVGFVYLAFFMALFSLSAGR